MTPPPDFSDLDDSARAADDVSRKYPVRSVLVVFYLVLTAMGAGLVHYHMGVDGIVRVFLGPGVVFSLVAGLVAAAATLAVCHLLLKRLRWMRRLSRVLRRLFGSIPATDAIWIGVLTGLGEELFFRAGLQPLLGLPLTSLLFGSLHVLPPLRRNWPWMIFAIVLGFALGWIYDRSGSLVGPVIAHAAINAVNLFRLGRT